MKPIYLTGFMGAGKTTIGKELGQYLSMTVFDTDEVIQNVMHQTINEIFEKQGEAAFRDLETKVIKKLAWDDVIITTGGGIVKKRENRDWMKATGLVIYLHCDPETIIKRLAYDQSRPLLKENREEQIMTLLEDRLPYYLEADFTINTSMKSTETIVGEIANYLDRIDEMWA